MSGPPIRPPLGRKGAGFLQRPPLKLKPFIMDAELSAAEQHLQTKGLVKAIVDAAVDIAAKEGRKADRAEINSLLRFIAQSNYLNREESRITGEIIKILGIKNADERLKTLDSFLTTTFKSWGSPPPYGQSDTEDLVYGRKTNTMFLQAGIRVLRQICDDAKSSAALIARELVPHADNMDAKGYSRWVHHLQQPKKEGAQVGVKKTIDFDKNTPLFVGPQQLRWAAYPIDADGDAIYEESFPLGIGKEYQFVPPPPMGQKPLNGKLLAIDERRGTLTIEVLQVLG